MDLAELTAQVQGDTVPGLHGVLEQAPLPQGDPPGTVLRVDEKHPTGTDDDVVEVGLRLSRPQQPVVQHRPRLAEVRQFLCHTSFTLRTSRPSRRCPVPRRGKLLSLALRASSPNCHERRC